MNGWSTQVAAAFGLGLALGVAPGPVQVLLLTEASREGIWRGVRVMAGVTSVFFAILAALSFGFAAWQPSDAVLRGLRLAGGGFLILLGIDELRGVLRGAGGETDGTNGRRRLQNPALRGALAVLLSPGAWLFFATTASAVLAQASADGGRGLALLTAAAIALGAATADFGSVLLGTGSRVVFGERALRVIRAVLAGLLVALGAAFVLGAVRAG